MMKPTNKNKVKPKYYLSVIFLVLFMAVFFTIMDSRKIKKLHSEYDRLSNKDSLNDVIGDIYKTKGVCFVTFKNGLKKIISPSRNMQYSIVNLDDNLEKEDEIKKNPDSDTIWIVNKNQYFIIGKIIEK